MKHPLLSYRRVPSIVLALVLLGLGTWPPLRTSAADDPKADQDAALQAAKSLYEGIIEQKLDNGLRVYIKPVPESPLVTVMVAYKVGSADEDLENTGLSHYLEHLMFKGTDKLRPGDIDRQTLQNGGANNAFTTEDYTVFHFDFSSDNWVIPLVIEADRMRNLRIDKEHEFEQEKGAVVAELKRNEDQPWDLEYKAILPLLFGKKSPYGHPVIGEKEHVWKATAETIKAHYDKWYQPGNAALVICGGIDPTVALAKVKELFGKIPNVDVPKRPEPVAHKPMRPERMTMPSKFDCAADDYGLQYGGYQKRGFLRPGTVAVPPEHRQD